METNAVAEIREKFVNKLENEGPPDRKSFHPADIARVNNDDSWLRRFLEHHEFNSAEAFNMLWDTCIWRSSFGTNDLTEDNVKKEYLENGLFFTYAKDKDGKKLFVIKSKLHKPKSAKEEIEEVRKCVVYWFERLEREVNGDQISIFFDMAESGFSNLDMDFTSFIVDLFKFYYPNFLNYIIIFEMPWVLSAAFKIIKTWLPAKAIPKIKFVNKTTLKEFVAPEDALICWGGSNDYTFTFEPEVRANGETANGKQDNKKVHFAKGSPLTEQSSTIFGNQTNEEQMMSVEPEVITFVRDGKEIVGAITVKNITTDKILTFKIKTTCPEKFRVRPSVGYLNPTESRKITIAPLPGYDVRTLLYHVRFLVMSLYLKDPDVTLQHLSELWKSGKGVQQHKLKCCDGTVINVAQKSPQLMSGLTGDGNERDIDAFFSKMNHLEEIYNKLHSKLDTLKYIFILCIGIICLFAVAILYTLKTDIKELVDQLDYATKGAKDSMYQQHCHIDREL